jgi:hypothetical protein
MGQGLAHSGIECVYRFYLNGIHAHPMRKICPVDLGVGQIKE